MNLGISLSLGSTHSAGFNPTSALFAAGEQGYWLDPSDFSTMFQDAAGTTPVTAVGQSVRRMLDKSGRGNTFTQANVANAPALQVDANGRHFLLFDGVDDWLQTGTITPGTDKAQVFAGLTKNNETVAIVLETGTSIGENSGALYLVTGADPAPANRYSSLARGSASASPSMAATTNTGNAPDTAVISAIHDIAGDLSRIRRNGVTGTDATADKGTGNFLAYPHYVGRRAGTSLPFNGRIYQLICRFGSNLTAAQITQAETFVNARTGAF